MNDTDSKDHAEPSDGHADTASLLLGLSSGHAGESAESTKRQATPVVASKPVQVARCTPAAVAAALMSANQECGTSSAGDATKNRRLQVSALPRKEWSAEEDALIRSGVQQLGCKWRVIAAQLPGRSDDAVRNRWSRLQESLRGGASQSRRTSADAGIAHRGNNVSRIDQDCNSSKRSTLCTDRHDQTGIGPKSGESSKADVGRCSEEKQRQPPTSSHDMPAEGQSTVVCSSSSTSTRESFQHELSPITTSEMGSSSARVCSQSHGSGSRGPGSAKGARSGSNGKPSSRRASHDGLGGASESGVSEKKERTSWTRAEDDVIIQGVSELGHKWYEIARRLPGRTDHAIRNRWSRLQSIIGMQAIGTDIGANLSPLLTTLATPSELQSVPLSSLSDFSAKTEGSMQQIRAMQPQPSFQVVSTAAADGQPRSDTEPSCNRLPHIISKPELASHGTLSSTALAAETKFVDARSAGSEASDAELTTGTADLLLLQQQNGGTSSCQPSPQITALSKAPEDCPELPVQNSAQDLLLLNKRPRVCDT